MKVFIFSGIWFGKEDHCQCGNVMGCAECYGTLRCGCSDCIQPSTKTYKLNKAKTKVLKFHTADTFQNDIDSLFETAQVSHAESLAVSRVKINTVVVEVEDVVLRRSHKSVDFKRRPMSIMETPRSNHRLHRMSLPEMPKFEIKPSEPKRKEKVREQISARDVAPPKQTRYFCKTCNVNVCNVCFTSTCGAHNVQFLGSSYFHCQSPFHKIQHEHHPL